MNKVAPAKGGGRRAAQQSRVWIQMQNSFAAGCGGGCVGAERKRECESAKYERACLRAVFFRNVMVPFEQQRQQNDSRAASERRDWLR
jgi:hypothetical protein